MKEKRNLISDMKYHYTYRITNITDGMYYYGVHSCDCLPKEDIGVKYFSSSSIKIFIKDQKQNPQNYKYKVIKIFPTRVEADEHEMILHAKFNVKLHDRFYNKWNSCTPHVYTSENKLEFWKNASDEFKLLHSINTSKGVSESWKNLSEEDYKSRCNNISKALMGKKEPEWKKQQHSKRMSGAGNSNAKKINIYNAKNELMFECHGNFKEICTENNLPHNALRNSYSNNNRKIYTTNFSLMRALNKGWEFYAGWYAKEMN